MKWPIGNSTRSPICERKGGVHFAGHSWLRRVCWVIVGAIAVVMGLPAAESPTEVERVGDLGRKECLVFEGMQAFSGAGILRPTEMCLEFYCRSDPAAALSDYLAWIERIVRQGYQRSGFAKVVVTARPTERRNASG